MFSSKFKVTCNACKNVLKTIDDLNIHSKCIIPIKKSFFKQSVSDSDSSTETESEIDDITEEDVEQCRELVKKSETKLDLLSNSYKLQVLRKNLFFNTLDIERYVDNIQYHHKTVMCNKNYQRNVLNHTLSNIEQRFHL